ncbi:glycosyltransferase family 2 protein [Dysgonomonas sp. Marseille-P4677]|uniref:glycosyltransferase n=1 Tax=Dysgonomonas sp. Marseille-P4677 TaxID=2364790 RepID=UPI001911F42B|nr:glycosyltransferase [Dysgonomonas sp. Marseille-P4677]MBK5719453.1 glycosyltransferase family 2 protein [Dysgonomonas sp. Marseille-P4677]
MLLTILIPTYNRCNDLLYNISLLEGFILSNSLEERVDIIISSNNSEDETKQKVTSFIKNTNIKITLYNQEANIGLEKNVIFTLSKAISEYVMFLGDDDYIDEEYLKRVICIISSEKDVHCIIPSFIGIKLDKTVIPTIQRDINAITKKYRKGFRSCLSLSNRGHQLSGLVFKRAGLYENYMQRNVQNIYPFIFFVSISILNGNTYHLTEYPVKVTQPGQEKKDWGYGEDGLVNEIFDNYKKIDLKILQRYLLEMNLLFTQDSRYLMYLEKSKMDCFNAFFKIITSKNSLLLTKLSFPFLFSYKLVVKYSKSLLRPAYKKIFR